MIQDVKISKEEIKELTDKGINVDSGKLNLHNISSSGVHVSEIVDCSEVNALDYNLENIANSGSHISDIVEE